MENAIANSNIKKTYTPCVLLLKAQEIEPLGNSVLSTQIAKIIDLPIKESIKSFRLFNSLFTVADKRRRENKCKNVCSHWWHKDLSDENTIRKIMLGNL